MRREEGTGEAMSNVELPAGISLMEHLCPEEIMSHLQSLRPHGDVRQRPSFAREEDCSVCGDGNLLFRSIPILCNACNEQIKEDEWYLCPALEKMADQDEEKMHFQNDRSRQDAFMKEDEEEEDTEHEEAEDTHTILCRACYKLQSQENIIHVGSSSRRVLKNTFKKCQFPSPAEEWVQCNKCKLWQHQICVLFNERLNKKSLKYFCPDCCLEMANHMKRSVMEEAYKQRNAGNESVEVATLVAGGWRAKDLPSTPLSRHIQQSLYTALAEERAQRASYFGKASPEEYK